MLTIARFLTEKQKQNPIKTNGCHQKMDGKLGYIY